MNVPVFCCVKTQEPLADRDTAALLSLLLCLAVPGSACGFLSRLGGGLFPSQGLGWEGVGE